MTTELTGAEHMAAGPPVVCLDDDSSADDVPLPPAATKSGRKSSLSRPRTPVFEPPKTPRPTGGAGDGVGETQFNKYVLQRKPSSWYVRCNEPVPHIEYVYMYRQRDKYVKMARDIDAKRKADVARLRRDVERHMMCRNEEAAAGLRRKDKLKEAEEARERAELELAKVVEASRQQAAESQRAAAASRRLVRHKCKSLLRTVAAHSAELAKLRRTVVTGRHTVDKVGRRCGEDAAAQCKPILRRLAASAARRRRKATTGAGASDASSQTPHVRDELARREQNMAANGRRLHALCQQLVVAYELGAHWSPDGGRSSLGRSSLVSLVSHVKDTALPALEQHGRAAAEHAHREMAGRDRRARLAAALDTWKKKGAGAE